MKQKGLKSDNQTAEPYLICSKENQWHVQRYSQFCFLWILTGCGTPATAPLDDAEWPVSSPESEGLDKGLLNDLASDLGAGDFGPISSLLIVRNGKLVYEQYRLGHTSAALHPLNSATKSVTSMLIGTSVGRGEIEDIDRPILTFFPERESSLEASEAKRRMTLRHVLQMRSGIRWDEWSSSYGSSQNPIKQLENSQDWVGFVLERTVVHEPGTWFTYNSGNSILVGEVLHRVTGQRTADLGNERLFRKLGIRDYFWFVGPNGVTDTSGGLSLRSRDMAKLGLLFLHRGQWEGEHLIPGDWVDDSIQLYSNFPGRGGYGYQWWIMDPVTRPTAN